MCDFVRIVQALIWLLLAAGCSASQTGRKKVNTASDATSEPTSKAGEDDPDAPTLAAVDHVLAQQSTELVLLGARHDLSLADSLPLSCECVAFAAGQTTDPRFIWDGAPPHALPMEQIAVAFHADAECLETRPAPSYQGYQVEGANVILLLEPAQPGRPELHGAIVPRPAAGGQLLVRSADPDAPYARGFKNADAPCAVRTDAEATK